MCVEGGGGSQVDRKGASWEKDVPSYHILYSRVSVDSYSTQTLKMSYVKYIIL